MPSEALPRDRKDFTISRTRLKTSHNEPKGFARWRTHDSLASLQGLRCQQFSEEPGHGCMPSMSSDRMVEGDSCHNHPGCRDREGKFGRNGYVNERLVSQNDWQESPSENAGTSANSSRRSPVLVSQRSVSVHPSQHHSDNEKIFSETLMSKDLPDTTGSSNGFNNDRKRHKDLSWELLKCSRFSSLPSRSSASCHSRSFGEDLDERITPLLEDVPLDKISSASLEEACFMRKQRIGWGQGLAKYEKKKVEVPNETICNNGLVTSASNSETPCSLVPVSSDKGPNVTPLSGSVSPATLSSISCSSSPAGLEEAANNIKEMIHLLPSDGCQNFDHVSSKLEHFELSHISNLSSLPVEFLQLEDSNSGDSGFLRSTLTSKLFLLKSNVLRALEKTETEIDVFENELKFLNSESVTSGSHPITSESLSVECTVSCEVARAEPKVPEKYGPVRLVSTVNTLVEIPRLCNGKVKDSCAEIQDVYVDNPRIAAAKSIEPQQLEKSISAPIIAESEEFSGVSQVAIFTSPVPLLVSNQITARETSEIFYKLLPTENSHLDIWEASRISCMQNISLVKEKLGIRKCFFRFKKKVLTLKFKALLNIWKEDLCLLSFKKSLAKPQIGFNSCLKTSASGCHKQRTSIRLRFTSSAGNLTVVPSIETLSFNSKLLANSQMKLDRTTLRMPALMLDEREKSVSRFVTRNGLVEDPCTIEKERATVNPWFPKEKEVFLEMLATFGKDFKKIASFLDHKTTADCVEFYYKNQKSDSFDSVKEKWQVNKNGRSFPTNTYLVSSGRKWRSDLNAASLDVLGAASVTAANADVSINQTDAGSVKSSFGGFCKSKSSRVKNGVLKNTRDDIIGGGAATYTNGLMGYCGSLSSELIMGYCGVSSTHPDQTCMEFKNQKTDSFTLDVPCDVDDEGTSSDEYCGDLYCGDLDYVDWTHEEKNILFRATQTYGKDFAKLAECIGSRSSAQCQIFFSKARKCLGLDLIHLIPDNEVSGYLETASQEVHRIEQIDPRCLLKAKEMVAEKQEVGNDDEKSSVEICGQKFIAATNLLQCNQESDASCFKASPAASVEGSRAESDRQAADIIHTSSSYAVPDSSTNVRSIDPCFSSSFDHQKQISSVKSKLVLRERGNYLFLPASIDHVEDHVRHDTISSNVLEEFEKKYHLKSSVQDGIKNNLSHENCNGTKQSSLSELPYLSTELHESSSDHRRAHSWSMSDGLEHSERTTDIKLFGQVLSPQPSSQNPLTTSRETNDKSLTRQKMTSEPFNLDLNDEGLDETSVPLKLDVSNHSGLEGFPLKNDFPASYEAGDEQPMPSVAKEKDLNLDSIPALTKDQELIDDRVYRSYEDTKVKPLAVVT